MVKWWVGKQINSVTLCFQIRTNSVSLPRQAKNEWTVRSRARLSRNRASVLKVPWINWVSFLISRRLPVRHLSPRRSNLSTKRVWRGWSITGQLNFQGQLGQCSKTAEKLTRSHKGAQRLNKRLANNSSNSYNTGAIHPQSPSGKRITWACLSRRRTT